MIATTMTLAEALHHEASAHPEREALVCDAGRFRYGEIADQTGRLAGGLYRLGVRKGDRVASLLGPGWHAAVLFFALARLGAVSVPLNPQLRSRQLQQILGEVEPCAVVSGLAPGGEAGQALAALVRGVGSVRHVIATERAAEGDLAFADLQGRACLVFTSIRKSMTCLSCSRLSSVPTGAPVMTEPQTSSHPPPVSRTMPTTSHAAMSSVVMGGAEASSASSAPCPARTDQPT